MRKMKTLRLITLLIAALMMISLLSVNAAAAVDGTLDLQEITESIEDGSIAAEAESALDDVTEAVEALEGETSGEAVLIDEGPHGSGPWTNNNGITFYMPYVEDTSERLFDYGDLLTADEEAQVRARIAELQEKKKAVVIILTSNDIPRDAYYGNETTMKYAEQFFMDLTGYSNTKDVDGFIFTLDMNNRLIYTAGAGRYKTEKYVDFAEEIYNDALNGMRSGNYAEVCNVMLDDYYKLDNIAYAAIPTMMSLIVSLVLSLLTLVILLAKHNKSQPVKNARIAVRTMNYHNLAHQMIFLGKHTTQRRIEKSSSSGGGGGGGFSGGSHSGGGFSGGGGGFSGGGGHF